MDERLPTSQSRGPAARRQQRHGDGVCRGSGWIFGAERDGGRGTAYTLRFGKWLVAINAHPSEPYGLLAPAGFSGGVELISGKTLSVPVTLAPRSAAVFRMN